jgi:hypothetical protein
MPDLIYPCHVCWLLSCVQVNGVLHVHLPDGPTAHYKITNLVLGKEIKVRPGEAVPWLYELSRFYMLM